jgi:hypothetical protein
MLATGSVLRPRPTQIMRERERDAKKNTSGPVETVLTHRFRFLYSELSLSLPSSQREQVQAHDIYRDDILLLPTPTQELT